jgi:hypothetical protein
MRTLEEAWNIIEGMNDDAHNESWDMWIKADELSESEEETDWDKSEELKEEASLQQSEYFRDFYYELDEQEQEVVKYWLNHDEDFREQFALWFGEEQFIDEFENEDE